MTLANKKNFSVLLFFIATVACKKDTAHLSMKQMEDVLFDISLAESYSTVARDNNHFGGIKNPDSLALYYKEIFTHHHITPAEFTTSLTWYKIHSDSLNVIYASILARDEKLLGEETKKAQAALPIAKPAPVADTPAIKGAKKIKPNIKLMKRGLIKKQPPGL